MLALALPLHAQYFPTHPDHADLGGPEHENLVISEVSITSPTGTPRAPVLSKMPDAIWMKPASLWHRNNWSPYRRTRTCR